LAAGFQVCCNPLDYKPIEVSGYLLATYGLHEVGVVFDVERTCQLLSEKNHSDDYINWYQSLAGRNQALPVFAGVTLVIAAAVKG